VPLTRLAYRIDPRQFEGRALLYLPLDKLEQIRERIFDYQDFMESFAGRPTLDELVDATATQIANALVGGFLDLGLSESRGALDLRFVRDLVSQISARLDRPTPYQSPWGGLFSVGGDSESAGYFLSDDQRLLFILAEPESKSGSFTADKAYAAGEANMIFRLGYDPQTIELGGVKVESFGKAIAMGGLPTSMTTDRRRAKAFAAANKDAANTAPVEAGDLTFEVDTGKVIRTISPYVYGINSQKDEGIGATVRRMGGNRQTGYNWETNASNAGNDYNHQSDEWSCTAMGYKDCSVPGKPSMA